MDIVHSDWRSQRNQVFYFVNSLVTVHYSANTNELKFSLCPNGNPANPSGSKNDENIRIYRFQDFFDYTSQP